MTETTTEAAPGAEDGQDAPPAGPDGQATGEPTGPAQDDTADADGDADGPEDQAPDEDEGGDRSRAGRDAAKYRRQLRDTEAERDTLRTQLDEYRASAAERIAAEAGLIDGSDVWGTAEGVGSFVGEDGSVDAEKVQAAVTELLERKPHLAGPRRPPGGRPTEALTVPRGGSDPNRDPEPSSWAGVLGRVTERREDDRHRTR